MTDEDGPALKESGGMLYDYFKHLTSLSILSLGGVLALADKVQGNRTVMVIGALAVIAVAALLSFSGAGEIVEANYRGKPLARHLNLYRVASPALLSVGLGMFLYIFLGTLKS